MNMPEFTAEASLYKASRHYHMEATPTIGATGKAILQQGVYCSGAGDETRCYLCDEWGCYQISGRGTRPRLE